MISSASGFYVLGGTLPRDSRSYVARQADTDLLDGLRRGQFCYVLTSRQMGKSSLMVRTATRLRQEHVTCIALDLTAVGQNMTEEQWYDGLLNSIAVQTDLEVELDDFWLSCKRLGALQRWMLALKSVVLARIPGRIVIFVDEIDAVRSLPFSADEFFAAIRECYNRRTEDQEFQRLTFCLLGVATPADLIRDTRSTPFNVGRRIELTDFTEHEAAVLTEGLSSDSSHETSALTRKYLARVLHWTGGHPYLTQRLFQAVADAMAQMCPPANTQAQARRSGAASTADVDAICAELFLNPHARNTDDNLLFVRERILRSESDRAGLLETYSRIWAGRRVKYDETSPLLGVLRLAGVVRVRGTVLEVRNRIYRRVFDGAWVRANMPDAELRRQKVAFQRGFARAAALSAVGVTVIATLAVTAMQESARARDNARIANAEKARAAQQAQAARRYLYAADMTLAQQAWNNHEFARVRDLLDETRPARGDTDLRGFEWGFLHRRGHFDLPFLPDAGSYVTSDIAFTLDGRLVRTNDGHGKITYWDAATGTIVTAPTAPQRLVRTCNISPGGDVVAEGKHFAPEESGAERAVVVLRNARTGRQLRTLRGAMGPAQFSIDGRLVATETAQGASVWDAATGNRIATFPGCSAPYAFSPDSHRIAMESFSYGWGVKILDIAGTREARAIAQSADCAALSPDGRVLATSLLDVTLRDAVTLQTLRKLPHAASPFAFMENGRTIATSEQRTSGVVALWDTERGVETGRFNTGVFDFGGFAAQPGGNLLAIYARDGGVSLWNTTTRAEVQALPHAAGTPAFGSDGRILAVCEPGTGVVLLESATGKRIRVLAGAMAPLAFSRNGLQLATGLENRAMALWDVSSGTQIRMFKGQRFAPHVCAFSPDGRRLVAGDSGEYNVTIWDTATGRETFRIPGKTDRTDVATYTLLFSPDGSRLYSGNQDGVTKVWQADPAR